MDPWWNPAVEQQAQDRIHRIGQNKPVWYGLLFVALWMPLIRAYYRLLICRIVRFVMGDTIEEAIIELQEKKKLLFEGQVSFSFSLYLVAYMF